MNTIQLSGSGQFKMPIVGLGTWRAKPEEVKSAVTAALECGYTHIGEQFFIINSNLKSSTAFYRHRLQL